jgi:hypothetical protein
LTTVDLQHDIMAVVLLIKLGSVLGSREDVRKTNGGSP